jgi:hypothetical protein
MKVIDHREWRELAREHDPLGIVSIYLPTHRTGQQVRQDPIRLKNLLSEADERLRRRGREPEAIDRMLEPARQLLNRKSFWLHQEEGLALFLSPRAMREYRCPLTFGELCIVGERYHLKPLLPLLIRDIEFRILALSLNKVRLFVASRHAIEEVALGEIPGRLTEALGSETDEHSLQYHTGAPYQSAAPASALYHGQGGGEDDRTDEALRFLRAVDHGLARRFGDRGVPLVLAGTRENVSRFRRVSDYPRLVAGEVAGNHDESEPHRLLEQAWPLIAPGLQSARQAAEDRWRQLQGTGKTSYDPQEIVREARNGRVDTLFVACDRQVWQRQAASGGEVAPGGEEDAGGDVHRGDQDLLELVARECLAQGATVYALPSDELPDDRPAAAIYRY